MNFKLVVSFLFFIAISINAKIVVISDLDETLRIAKTHSVGGAIAEIVKGVKPFPVMKNIFNNLKSDGAEFFYVSAASPAYYDASSWLKKFKFPTGKVFQKQISESTSDYKYETITAILSPLNLNEKDTLLLFGDNASKDEFVYTRIAKDFSGPKVLIFIRDIRAQATLFAEQLPAIQIDGPHYFFTEYELLSSGLIAHLSDETVQLILANYRNKVVFSPSPEVFLEKRIKREICEKLSSRNEEEKCEKGARQWANTLISSYFF